MEDVETKIIIDTDFAIDYLRGREYAINKVDELKVSSELGTTDVNAFELFRGAFKSRNEDKNLASVKGFLNTLFLASTNKDAMEIAAKISIDLERKGTPVDVRDIFVAAICLLNSHALLTNNKKHFKKFEGLKLI